MWSVPFEIICTGPTPKKTSCALCWKPYGHMWIRVEQCWKIILPEQQLCHEPCDSIRLCLESTYSSSTPSTVLPRSLLLRLKIREDKSFHFLHPAYLFFFPLYLLCINSHVTSLWTGSHSDDSGFQFSIYNDLFLCALVF